MKKYLFFLLLVFLAFAPVRVSAQEVVPLIEGEPIEEAANVETKVSEGVATNSDLVSTTTINSESIISKESIAGEIATVRQTYKGQLAEYRQAADQFAIAKKQFEQLNTLASLEVAVQATQEVMMLRAQVLSTYLKILELELLEAEGINLEEKDVAMGMVKTLQRDFVEHYSLLEKSIDRVGVATAADEFLILSPQVQSVGAYVEDLLKVGKLQTIYDKVSTLMVEVDPNNSDQEPSLELNQQIRAHTEIQKTLDTTDSTLKLVWNRIRDARLDSKVVDVSKNSASVYASLSQALVFLEEILR